MVNPHHVVIEAYVLLAVINAFLGITQGIYSDAHLMQYGNETRAFDPATDPPWRNFAERFGEGSSIRSPFTQAPLSANITADVSQLDIPSLQANLTNPMNATGGPIEWLVGNVANFAATVELVTTFVKFFTAGYVIDLLGGFGFPSDFIYIITVPLGIYTAYMILVLITNRLGN